MQGTGVQQTPAGPHFWASVAADCYYVIDAKWLVSWKHDELGWIIKATSRLVARGFKQHGGIVFGETFALTVSSSCVCLLSAIPCELDLDMCRFDVE